MKFLMLFLPLFLSISMQMKVNLPSSPLIPPDLADDINVEVDLDFLKNENEEEGNEPASLSFLETDESEDQDSTPDLSFLQKNEDDQVSYLKLDGIGNLLKLK